MPRLPRVHLQNALYFVTLDGPQSEPIYRDQADYQKYLELISKYKTEYRFKLYSYALLPHRLHLLIEPNEEFPISQIMQQITPSYTKYYNGRYQRKGPLFQKRFRSVVTEKETYLAPLTRYVHLTPVQSELASDFRDYPHTSFTAFSKVRRENAIVSSMNLSIEVEEVLRYLPNPNQEDAYERYMLSADPSEINFMEKKLSRGAFLGSDQFAAEVKKRMEDRLQKEATLSEPSSREPAANPAVLMVSKRMVGLLSLLVLTVVLSAFSVYFNYQTMPPVVRDSPAQHVWSTPRGVVFNTIPAQSVDLNGTIWEVELVSVSTDGTKKSIKDKIKFTGKTFESYYFTGQGFSRSNYTVTVNENGVITWETVQRNEKGETVSWRGDWNGKQMEGMTSFHPAGNNPQDFSFMGSGLGVQK